MSAGDDDDERVHTRRGSRGRPVRNPRRHRARRRTPRRARRAAAARGWGRGRGRRASCDAAPLAPSFRSPSSVAHRGVQRGLVGAPGGWLRHRVSRGSDSVAPARELRQCRDPRARHCRGLRRDVPRPALPPVVAADGRGSVRESGRRLRGRCPLLRGGDVALPGSGVGHPGAEPSAPFSGPTDSARRHATRASGARSCAPVDRHLVGGLFRLAGRDRRRRVPRRCRGGSSPGPVTCQTRDAYSWLPSRGRKRWTA